MKILRADILLSAMVLAAAIATGTAKAGPVYIYVVADPSTTAGAGVAASNGMTVISNRSGPGTFQLYAVDDVAGSFGIKSWSIKLNGTITALLNRSPNGNWLDGGGVTYQQGFNDVRTAVFATGTVTGGQGPTNPVFITGIGRTAGDFPTSNPLDVSSTQTTTAAGQWGNYAPTIGVPTSGYVNGALRSAVFLAEGNYTGAPPTVDLTTAASLGGTAVNLLSSANGGAAFSATSFSKENPFWAFEAIIDNVNANNPGVVTLDLSPYYPGPSPDGFWFLNFVSPTGVNGHPSLANPPTIDPITKVFRWNTTGAAPGSYAWHTSYGGGWDPHVDIRVRITAVPEPAVFSLASLAMIGSIGILRRRA